MILEIITGIGPTLITGGVGAVIIHRGLQFKKAVRKGVGMHVFEPNIIRHDFRKIELRDCKKCKQPRRAWIHEVYSEDTPDGPQSRGSRILQLEREDVKWRFANDPEWVKVFGEDYDPKTFEPIPQFHNGECGGPNDSCERCIWEQERKDRQGEFEKYMEMRKSGDELKKAIEAEVRIYTDVLGTLWNTAHDPDIALAAFEDIQDELGMLENATIRNKVKDSDVFRRVHYCLPKHDHDKLEQRWKRRQELADRYPWDL